MMDDLIQYNKERWNALAQANYTYTRPFLDLNAQKARAWLNSLGEAPSGLFDSLTGKDINTLVQNQFLLLGLWEDSESAKPDPDAEPGSWEHLIAVAPPFLRIWAVYRPELFGSRLLAF